MIESFARCPVCKRNDKVQKVTGLNLKENDSLYSQLMKPAKPKNANIPDGCSRILLTLVFTSVFGFGVWGKIAYPNSTKLLPYFILLVIAIAIIWRFIHLRNSYYSKQKEIDEIEIPAWNKAIQKWETLYYCSRDDCVFIPGQNEYIPSNMTQSYIYENEN